MAGSDPWRRHLRAAYLELDPRSLGLGRIVLGLVLLVDLVRRVPWIRDLYSNEGLLPNHTILWRPPMPRIFSAFFMASFPDEAALLFVICFVCFFCFLIGYRTRLFHILSFVLSVSLHNRIVMAENGGIVALTALMLWTMFLPLGARFSVDAVRASLRARRQETPADLRAGLPAPANAPVTSLAVLALLLQLAVIYYFNCVHKTGETWRSGTAVHYVLWQERIVTTLGVWARENVPFAITRALTWGTLIIEGAAPLLLLTPFAWRWTRSIAIVALAGLHIGIAFLVNLGIFSAVMVAYYPFLLAGRNWDTLARVVPRRARTVYYDAGCGICFTIVRVLARLDVHRRLTFVPNDDPQVDADGIDRALLDRTMVVVDRSRGTRRMYEAAIADVLAALPLGRWWAWPLRLPGLRALARAGYDAFARRRSDISRALGLGVCHVPGARPVAAEPPVSPLRAAVRARLPVMRELLVALALWVNVQEVLVANAAVPRALRLPRPDWMVHAIMYPRLYQSWSMFSPEAPLRDMMVYVDAVTRDGRHVDPLNAIGSRTATLPLRAIPPRLGHDSFFCDYTLRIPGHGLYHQAFIEWVLRYPERTGRDEDAIVSFEAHVLEHRSPAPGESQPTDVTDRVFLRYPR